MNIFAFWTYEDGVSPPMTNPRPVEVGGSRILSGCRSWGLAVSGVAPKRMGWCEVTRPLPFFHLTQRWNWWTPAGWHHPT